MFEGVCLGGEHLSPNGQTDTYKNLSATTVVDGNNCIFFTKISSINLGKLKLTV